jgi:hypothetical protein
MPSSLKALMMRSASILLVRLDQFQGLFEGDIVRVDLLERDEVAAP